MAKTLASIDVGTSKVCSIVANLGDEDTMQILGVGVVPSRGVHKGLVVNIDEAKEAIWESVMRAERTSGVRIESAYVGVTGKHISSLNSRGVVATTRSDKRVTADDLDRVLESARSINIPDDRSLLHVIPHHYTLDGRVAVKEPVGMHSFRLDVETHIVTVSATSVQNLIKSVRGVGVEIDNLVFNPLAAGEAVLSADERNAGVILADIGAGTTEVAIFKEGRVWHSAILPVGGYQVTGDIALGLSIPNELAEEMKRKYGNLMTTNGRGAEHSELDVGNRHTVSYRELNDIMRVRVEEILQLVMMEIPRGEWDVLTPAGLILTGGTANIPGIDLLAREVLGMHHVRVGVPGNISGIVDTLHDPAFATSVGLLFWGARSEDEWRIEELKPGVIGTLKNTLLSARRFLRRR
jgi:cell division protein FtsA